MINISSASSLFEIMFAVNAVFAYVITKYSENKEIICTHICSQLIKAGKYKEDIELKYIEKSSYEMFPYFKLMNTVLMKCGVCFALAGTAVPVSLLVWASIAEDTAQIYNWLFYIILFLFLIGTPIFYYCYYILSKNILRKICSHNFITGELELITLHAQVLSSAADTNNEKVDFQLLMFWHRLRQNRLRLRLFFTQKINPFYRYRHWKLNKLINEMDEEHNKANSADA